MTCYTALTKAADEDTAYALADDLEAIQPEPTGVGVFEIEDGSGLWEVGVYSDTPPDEAALAVMTALHGVEPFIVSEVPDQDWVSKVRRDLAPVEAGRFFVHGSHDADKVPSDKVPLLIEAAMAFGTGHHGTTLGCLRAFDALIDQGVRPASVIDIGCGTAVLAMAAATQLDVPIVASDIDPVAIDVSLANLKANDLDGKVTCHVAAGLSAPELSRHAPYELVFANILKGPLIALSPEIAAATAVGGHVVLSGILNEQAGDVIAVYAQNGVSLVTRSEIGDWTTLVLQKQA